MARTLTTNLRNAIDIDGSYYPHIKAVIYPSRIYFEVVVEDFVITTGADTLGYMDEPMRQDIIYNSTVGGLVTFWTDSSGNIKYSVQGSSSITTISSPTVSYAKPGVIGSVLYAESSGSQITRYGINWTDISNRSTSPLTSQQAITRTYTPYAIHAISSDECVYITYDDGGLRPVYIDNTTEYECPIRFMSPMFREKESLPTPQQQIICTGAARLGNKVFVYASNFVIGVVEGCYYDTDTGVWSDIFTVLPTDLDVSQCEFRIANVYEHNGSLFMCGLFNRTDNVASAQPYSLLLSSTNGRTFCINRNVLVSNIGYRFLAHAGTNNYLYLSNCNRIGSAPITWVFDGANSVDANVVHTDISEDDIKAYSDSDLARCSNLTLRAGLEQYFQEAHPNIVQGARLVVWAGLTVASGIEWVKYATYIIDGIDYGIGVGKRSTVINATNEAIWNLSGLSMPFYAEILGKSCGFDPMLEDTTTMASAGNGCIARTSLLVDFWDHEPYSDDTQTPDLVGVDMNDNGGVNYHEALGGAGHYLGLMTREELQTKCVLHSNPKITATSVTAKVYGWSRAVTGSANDEIRLILLTEDEEGIETTTIFTTTNHHFPNTYPDAAAGYLPVEFTCTGLTVGHTIKKVGVAFYTPTYETWFNIARVEFTAGILAYYPLYGADTPWEALKDGSHKLPRAGKPFVMVSSSPYNAFDFSLAAQFKNTVDDSGAVPSTYPAACGLVGHCEDGLNYTVGRYNRQTDSAELVVCRDGIETTLLSTALTFTINDTLQIRFDHRGGHFDIYMVDDTVGYYKKVLGTAGAGYDWEAADGYMYTSDTASMRCGIYGYIATPTARILGFYESGDEADMSADGMPFDPLWPTTDFPQNGFVSIMDNEYEYFDKVAHPTIPRGPYQFRQMDDYETLGNGDGFGLECRDFDWTASASLNNGYLIAINSGANYKCSDTDWQIWISTGGVTEWIRNRARYYSANVMISKLYHSLGNKVWVVGGLLGDFTDPDAPVRIRLSAGTKTIYHEGDFATYKIPGEILCYWYMGTGGEDDTTVGDITQRICDLSGARCQFPSNWTNDGSSLVVGSLQNILTTDYAEGYDFSFGVASFNSGSLTIRMSATLNAENYDNKISFDGDTHLEVKIEALGSGSYRYTLSSYDSNTIIYSTNFTTGTGAQKFRIMCMRDNIGLYQNGQWVTTIALDEVVYGDTLTISVYASVSMTLTTPVLADLSDWREAIYIDLETDGVSALGSVIQQRPVEKYAQPDGSISFWYEPSRHVITAVREPRQHSYVYSVPSGGASDAIVYGLKDVRTIQHKGFAKELGFATRMMRMPDLGTGAMRATNIILQRMLEEYHKHELLIRPDLEVLPGDEYDFTYTDAGTGTEHTAELIVETVSYDFRVSGTKSISSMRITGREKYVYTCET